MVDFEDLSNAADGFGFYQRKAALEQQEETNRLLRQQQAEQNRINRLPKCLECAGVLPTVGVGTCMHCGFKMSWVGSTPCVPGTEEQTTVLLEKEAERRRRADLKRAKEQQELSRQEKTRKEALKAKQGRANAGCMVSVAIPFVLLGFAAFFLSPPPLPTLQVDQLWTRKWEVLLLY